MTEKEQEKKRDYLREILPYQPKLMSALENHGEEGLTLTRGLIYDAPFGKLKELLRTEKGLPEIDTRKPISYRYVGGLLAVMVHVEGNKGRKTVCVETNTSVGLHLVRLCDDCLPPIFFFNCIVCVYNLEDKYSISVNGHRILLDKEGKAIRNIDDLIKAVETTEDEKISPLKKLIIDYLSDRNEFISHGVKWTEVDNENDHTMLISGIKLTNPDGERQLLAFRHGSLWLATSPW